MNYKTNKKINNLTIFNEIQRINVNDFINIKKQ